MEAQCDIIISGVPHHHFWHFCWSQGPTLARWETCIAGAILELLCLGMD